ncbi:helix-turn-helix domain-containing protein [Vulcanisaeta thermophila]|uniref:helix-turn-helix domain-containing protein n=1 Tax=Vulcanisaeta thermophila TaxID=867917 RepID=UPI0008534D9B|nr:helix-turn-helix domain-containing protein [Vulcanisaeta thermophila]
MSSKLSKTEEMAAKLYFNEKLKPKEIAQKLGISVNTVYKAISKYRSLFRTIDDNQPNNTINNTNGDGESSDYNGAFTYSINFSVIMNQQPTGGVVVRGYGVNEEELLNELRELRKLVEELLARISKMESLGCRDSPSPSIKTIVESGPVDDPLPDFLRDNPWIDVLRSIRT